MPPSTHDYDKELTTMTHATNTQIIQQYYDAFNNKNLLAFFELLTDDVIHDINQGETEIGIAKFKQFMDTAYSYGDETVNDLIILTSPDGKYAATRFNVSGVYLKTFPGCPEAAGQTYLLPVVAFFEFNHQRISRVSTFYNMQDWIKQVSFFD